MLVKEEGRRVGCRGGGLGEWVVVRIGREGLERTWEEGVATTEGWRRGEEGALRRHSGARGADRR